MTILVKSNSYSTSKIKSELKKYCYVNHESSFEQDRLRYSIRSLIEACEDKELLETIYDIFDNCIRCYYRDYRTEFNRIRSMFMMLVMNILLVKRDTEFFIKSVKESYETWCYYSYIIDGKDCALVKKKAIEYLKLID